MPVQSNVPSTIVRHTAIVGKHPIPGTKSASKSYRQGNQLQSPIPLFYIQKARAAIHQKNQKNAKKQKTAAHLHLFQTANKQWLTIRKKHLAGL